MKVLLIVDVQKDFCPGGSLAVPEGDKIVPVVNALARSGEFDLTIASKDWHPDGHKSFAVNHAGKGLFEQIDLNGLQQTLWPKHCVEGTSGAELHPDLDQSRIHYVVVKGTDVEVDSYSAFFDNGKRHESYLRPLLEAEAVARGETLANVELFVCGLATDYCVAATARDARELGFKTTVIYDACRAVNLKPDDELNVLHDLVERGVVLDTSQNLLERSRPVERGLRVAA